MWSSTYGGTGYEYAYSLRTTTDGGYIVAGERSPGDLLLVKFDGSGGSQWMKTYGGGGSDAASSVAQTLDGGFAVGGWTYSFSAPPFNPLEFWVLRLDSSGDIGGTRSGVASDFSTPVCVGKDGTATGGSDANNPSEGAAYLYLVRAKNACGGNLGTRSDGSPRHGGACP